MIDFHSTWIAWMFCLFAASGCWLYLQVLRLLYLSSRREEERERIAKVSARVGIGFIVFAVSGLVMWVIWVAGQLKIWFHGICGGVK